MACKTWNRACQAPSEFQVAIADDSALVVLLRIAGGIGSLWAWSVPRRMRFKLSAARSLLRDCYEFS